MDKAIILTILVVCSIISIGGLLVSLYRILFVFRRSNTNPYTRYCKICGQQQDLYASNIEGSDLTWWEDMGLVKDDKCICHYFARY